MNDQFPTIQSPPGPSDAELQAERDAQHEIDVAEWFATQDRLDNLRERLPADTFRWNTRPIRQENKC